MGSGFAQLIGELLDEVEGAEDFSETTRQRLKDLIQRIQAAAQNIWIDGTGRLTTEIQATVGEVVTAPVAQTQQPNSTVKRSS
jgi:hypothetical protein